MMPNYCNIHHHKVNLYKDPRYMNIYIQNFFSNISFENYWNLFLQFSAVEFYYRLEKEIFPIRWKSNKISSLVSGTRTTLDSVRQFVRHYCLFHIWSQYLITLGLVNVWCCQQITENLSLVVSLIVTRSCLLEIVPPLQQKI